MQKIKCPVLAINGTKDVQVDADMNLDAFSRCVQGAVIGRMKGLNHLLQHATTGDVGEYQKINETISPEVLRLISDFVAGL
ncbi:MAG: hypothetical protein K2M12_06785 [Muribaculaceae bacterium]|nr:hypothetical protein [Muribaculaceae bacterium]